MKTPRQYPEPSTRRRSLLIAALVVGRLGGLHRLPGHASWSSPPPSWSASWSGPASKRCGPGWSPGETPVGTHVNVSHVAATPAGMKVTASVKLVAQEGRKLTFRVTCRDEVDLIGEGTHERASSVPRSSWRVVLAAKGPSSLKRRRTTAAINKNP